MHRKQAIKMIEELLAWVPSGIFPGNLKQLKKLNKDDYPEILMNWLEKKFGKDCFILVGFKSPEDRLHFDKNIRPILIKDKLVIKKLPKEAKSLAIEGFIKGHYSHISSKLNDEELHEAIDYLEELVNAILVVISPYPHSL